MIHPPFPAPGRRVPARLSAIVPFAGAVFCLGIVSPAAAQAVAAPAAGASATEAAAVRLSPFEVREDSDNGYTATSALSGGRTDTPLKLTAAAVSVMTAQFLQDIAATNFNGASEWATNVVPQIDTTHQIDAGFAINLRNMGNSFVSRNHFMWYVESDSYNTERYEFSRGPNGVLFGDSGAGGLATTLTKRPRFDRRATSLGAWGTSYGGYRATLDHNQPLTKNVSVRLNALYENMPTWREHTDMIRFGTHLAAAWRVTSRNQIRAEFEHGGHRRAMLPNYYTDNASFWDGRTVFDGTNAPATGATTGLARMANNTPYLVYIPGTANNGLNDYQGFYQSTGTGLGLAPAARQRTDVPNIARLPYKDWNLQPKDSMATLDYDTGTIFVDHRFSNDLHVEVGYNRLRNRRDVQHSQLRFSDYRIDVNRTLPGGAPNPNFLKPFADLNARIGGRGTNTVDDLRALGNYRFETAWLAQSFVGIVGSRTDRYNFWGRNMRRVNGPIANINDPSNIIRERRYWDQVGTSYGDLPPIPGVELDWVITSHDRQRKTIDYGQVLSTSRLFHDRLAVTLGARRDNVRNYQETSSGMPTLPDGRPQLGAVLVAPGGSPRNVLGARARSEFQPTSTNAGVVYYVLRDFGVFANRSETFSTPGNGANYLNGTPPGIFTAVGYDFGFKLELFNGKVSGTASYYESTQKDRPTGGTRVTELNRLWTNIGRNDLAILNQYRDTEDVKGKGYEVDLNANPTRNLRLTFNLAFPEATSSNLRPSLIAYFNAHLAQWQAGANDPNNPNRAQIASDLAAIQSDINSLTPGTTFNNTYKYTSNVYATYTFPGRWRNLSAGGGAQIRGRNKVGNVQVPANQPYNYLYADAYTIASAHVAYRHRFNDTLSARFQLNVSNLFDEDALLVRNYSTYRVGGLSTNPLVQVPNQIGLADPRKFTLSATFEF